MPLSVMIWALFVVPLWMLLAQLPAALGSTEQPAPSLLMLGFAVATVAVLLLDRRLGPPGPVRRGLPEEALQLVFAVVAGIGITILASELGNIGTHMADAGQSEPETELAATPGELAALGVLFRITLMAVVIGISLRALLAFHRPWTAVVLAALLGALPAPLHLWPQLALCMGLPAWLFRHTRSMGLALAGYLPMVLLPLLELAGLGPGIRGFDVVDPDAYVFQPVWFNIVGAVLVAAGVGPLLTRFEAERVAIEGDGDA